MIEPRVILLNMPTTIKGYVLQTADGDLTIVLNSRLTWEQNVKSYIHELAHISADDFANTASASAIESRTHKKGGPE